RDGDDRRPARVGAPALDLLVDVDAAVPAAVGEHRDQEPGDDAPLAADSAEAEPAAGDVVGPGVIPEYVEQPPDRQTNQDRVLDHRHDDLTSGGDPDADDRDHGHHHPDGGRDEH